MVSYTHLNVAEPLAFVFEKVGLHWVAGVVAVSAVIATASVLLVFQVGQPRIWMSMSRDGLLPPIFSRLHPKFGTPSFSTILTGLVVGIPALFVNMDIMVDLTSIGTLFAFALVSGGVMMLDSMPDRPTSRFKTPYIRYVSVVYLSSGCQSTLMYSKRMSDWIRDTIWPSSVRPSRIIYL